MADSRSKLNPLLRRLVKAAEAKGHVVHVYTVRKGRPFGLPVLMFAINGFPRKVLAECLAKLELCAGQKLGSVAQ